MTSLPSNKKETKRQKISSSKAFARLVKKNLLTSWRKTTTGHLLCGAQSEIMMKTGMVSWVVMNLSFASVNTSHMSLKANLLSTTLENILLTMTKTWWIIPRSNRASSTGCQELTLKRSPLLPWRNQTLSRSLCLCDKRFTQELTSSNLWIGHSKSLSQQSKCKSLPQLHQKCRLWLQGT